MSAMEEFMSAALGAPEGRRTEALRVLRGEVAAAKAAPQSEGPLLLGMGQAAKYLGVSRPTMWRMLQAGRLEKVEILPGSYRMRRADLDRYVAENGTAECGEDAPDNLKPGALKNRSCGTVENPNKRQHA